MAARYGMDLGVKGIYVYQIVVGGPLYGSGIQRGDIITKIDDKPVDDYTQLQKTVESYQSRKYGKSNLYAGRFGTDSRSNPSGTGTPDG